MKKIFITGSTGFTGQHACRYFLEKGYDVFAGVRKKRHPLKNVKSIDYTLTNLEELEETMEAINPDFILHLAAQNHTGLSWEEPLSTFHTNLFGTFYLLESIRNRAPHAVTLVIGSMIEYNPCMSELHSHPYGLSKHLQSVLSMGWSKLFQLDIRIVRPSNLIGPGPSNGLCSLLARACLNPDKSFHIDNILDRRDFLDVRDAVKAYEVVLLAGVPGETYDVATGNEQTFLKAVSILKSITGSDLHFSTDEFYHPPRDSIDNSKIRSLGWEPSISFEKSLEDIVEYYRV
ncbi:NAD(P)-dependent oxidoreductase [Rossellomorea sp. KS-H15a]|uniref:NAD-dependent epimerase/dehydratase family protein n=1 Tax=Rossellomorea sp. KS-H15a TaxID=2963940 RepID=UPI0020C6BECC|nr:NAD-dependent epimerase/dehydratase family protein [Rossellomorea sp. KS-H15a]UTE75475.1 GDP-mannose 4,6-dehydratase [Rossellomorea sp. KS-H15a]